MTPHTSERLFSHASPVYPTLMSGSMDLLDGNRASSPTQADRLNSKFDQLRDEMLGLLASDTQSRETIHNLETKLSIYQRAYADLEVDRKKIERSNEDLESQLKKIEKSKEDLESQLKGHRIITLLDGDDAIFSNDLISRGQAGGHSAGKLLSDSVMQHISSTYGPNPYQLWVYVFYNKRGLMDTFERVGLVFLKAKFEDFVMGFNQAAERFLMVDVGNAKEAADAKIKAHLEDDIRLSQTCKVVFGGCHDNGYVTNLRSQITAGLKHKLILLRSYNEIAAGIAELDLPTLTIPNLFMIRKLSISELHVPTTRFPEVYSRPYTNAVLNTASKAPLLPPGLALGSGVTAKPLAEVSTMKRPTAAISYSSAVQVVTKRPPTPELDSGSSDSSDGSDIMFDPQTVSTSSKSRRISPNIPLSKQKPPPCTLFYLANCKHGAECKYGHDYLLEAEHFTEIRANAKKAPCPSVNKGEHCIWGEECCYGHHCSMTTKCHFYKQGRCKFLGADMHKEPKAQAIEIL